MRRFLWLSLGVLLLAGVAVASSGGATQAEARWVITDLGAPPGGEWSVAYAINDRGQIVGLSYDKEWGSVVFLWESGKMRSIGLDSVSDINERGQVVGYVRLGQDAKSPFDLRPALWEKGKTRLLGKNWTEWNDTSRIGINDRGQIVGRGYTGERDKWGDEVLHLYLWEKGKTRDLGTLGGYSMDPDAINNRGEIVGRTASSDSFLWSNGKMIDLGSSFTPAIDPLLLDTKIWPWKLRGTSHAPLNDGGQIAGYVEPRNYSAAVWEDGKVRVLAKTDKIKSSRAIDINEAGTAVGSCTVLPEKPGGFGKRMHPCLWRDGKVYDLGLVYGEIGLALAINDRGQVFGNSCTTVDAFGTHGPEHAFVWEDGKMTDLGTLPGGKRSWALGMNNRGQIVGTSLTRGGKAHAVLWTLKRS